MPIELRCGDCAKRVTDQDGQVLCRTCSASTCSNCSDVEEKLYCETCAEALFGSIADPQPDADELIGSLVDARILRVLSAAIRRGDTAAAEVELDKLAAEVTGWTNEVSIGRYSPQARAA
jgi:hypothetical protein